MVAMSAQPSDVKGAPKPGAPTLQEKMLLLYSEGADDVEVAAALDLDEGRFRALYEELPSFKKIVDLGRTKSKAWWYHAGRRNLLSKGFQGATWNMNMKNRFKWADKVDIGDKGSEGPETAAELEGEIINTVQRIHKTAPNLARKIMADSDDE